MKAARIAADVERSDGTAVRIRDWRTGAGENAIGVEEVFIGVNDSRQTIDQRGTDCIGAAIRLCPRDAGTQRHAIRFFDEIVIAEAMQDDTVVISR